MPTSGRLPEGEDAYVGSRRWNRNECYWDFIVRRERDFQVQKQRKDPAIGESIAP